RNVIIQCHKRRPPRHNPRRPPATREAPRMTPTSYSPTLAVVADVVQRAVVRWPKERCRIERGAALLAAGAVSPASPTSYAVRSATDAGVFYAVTLDSCTCRDAQRIGPHHACKHRWACDLLAIATERQRRLDAADAERRARARVTADTVALAYARAVGFGGLR